MFNLDYTYEALSLFFYFVNVILKFCFIIREKRLEQESLLLKNQIQCLNEELNKQTAELACLKKENSTKFVLLESEISEKTQQLKISEVTILDLKESNEKLSQKVESLLQKLLEQRNSSDQMFDNFQQELQAQTKLTQLYQGLFFFLKFELIFTSLYRYI